MQSQVELFHLHIVANQDEVDKARIDLEILSNRALVDHKVRVTNLVRIGEFMMSIGDVACEIDADLIIMGTHGIKGKQWLTGSNAMRIIAHSKVPILISQDTKEKLVQHIVVPLDTKSETRQKLDMAIKLAVAYKARIHLLVERDLETLSIDKMNKLIKQVSTYISDHKVEYTLNYEDHTITNSRLLDFSYRVGADLITIINYQEAVYTELFGLTREQDLITNKYNIPVLCVNAQQKSNIITAY